MLNNQGFDLWADNYDASVGVSDEEGTYPFAGYKEVLNIIFNRVLTHPGKTVLDIGFGTATLTAKLYENGCTVYGQDFSRKMIELAQKKMPEASLFQGDFSQGLVSELTGIAAELGSDTAFFVRNTPQLCTANADDYKDGGTAQWTSTPTQPAIRPQSVVRYNGQFFATSAEGQILSSVNGTDWVSTGASLQASTLVAAGSDQLIAMSNGKFYSSPDGISWTEDAADESEYLPTGAVDGTCIPSPLHKTFETLIAVGQRDGKSVVWARDIDLTDRETFPWTYFPISDEDYAYNIPALNEITLNTYDGVPLLSGLTPEGQCAPLYLSRDNGHSWKDGELKTPAAQAQGALSVTVDDDNFVWMFCGQTGEVWRGRINRLGWKDINGSFERALKRN